MIRHVLTVLLSASIGIAAYALLTNRQAPGVDPTAAAAGRANYGPQLDALNDTVSFEVAERRRLEDALFSLEQRLAALEAMSGIAGATSAPFGDSRASAVSVERSAEERAKAAAGSASGAPAADELARYLDAGLDPVLAAELKSRDDAARLARANLRDQAEREGWLDSARFTEELRDLAVWHTELRPELGDQAYDQFLYASGRPNRVVVREVLEGSSAAQSGLVAGDTILSYGGDRIFDTRALQDATSGGSAGAQTLVEVLRNGERITLYLPRGPLGAGLRQGTSNPADE